MIACFAICLALSNLQKGFGFLTRSILAGSISVDKNIPGEYHCLDQAISAPWIPMRDFGEQFRKHFGKKYRFDY